MGTGGMGNGAYGTIRYRGVQAIWAIGTHGARVQGVWAVGAYGAIGYRGMEYNGYQLHGRWGTWGKGTGGMGSRGIWNNRVQGYGVQDTWAVGTGSVGHMGTGGMGKGYGHMGQ